MEVKKLSSTPVAVKWALINFVASIIITYGVQFLNVDPTSPVQYLAAIPFAAFLFLTQNEYKEQLGGYITFGDGFSSAFKYALITGVLGAIFIYLYFVVLSPEMVDKIVTSTQEKMLAKGASQEVIDKSLPMIHNFVAIGGAIGAIIAAAIQGVIFGLIGAAIFKKERSPFDIQDTTGDDKEVYDEPADPTV